MAVDFSSGSEKSSTQPMILTSADGANSFHGDVALDSMRPRILVVGIGGAGGNAIKSMMSSLGDGVDYLAVNTDVQHLLHSPAQKKLQIGRKLTRGLGAGAIPKIGKDAAEESQDEIAQIIADYDMVFITAGMGGGTGTGASSVFARIAKEQGSLVVAVVTKPFDFEGKRRYTSAEEGINELSKHSDTLIIIPNQNLFRVANEKTSFADAFRMADSVLCNGIKCITDLITMPGLINLDFADVKTVMADMGRAMMSTYEASGDERSIRASEGAMINPLLNISMKGAEAVLINITGGQDMTLFEVDMAVNRIREDLDEHCRIIFGAIFDDTCDGKIRVSIVATGLGEKIENTENKKIQGTEDKPIAKKTPSGEMFQSEDKKAPIKVTKPDITIDELRRLRKYEKNEEQQQVNHNTFEDDVDIEDAELPLFSSNIQVVDMNRSKKSSIKADFFANTVSVEDNDNDFTSDRARKNDSVRIPRELSTNTNNESNHEQEIIDDSQDDDFGGGGIINNVMSAFKKRGTLNAVKKKFLKHEDEQSMIDESISDEMDFSERSMDYIDYLKKNLKKIIGGPELRFSIIEQANYTVKNSVLNITNLDMPAYKRVSSS